MSAFDPKRTLRAVQIDNHPRWVKVKNPHAHTVNLKSERGLDLVKNMAKHADVMVENFAPGAIERPS